MKFIQIGNYFFALNRFEYYEFKTSKNLGVKLVIKGTRPDDYFVTLEEWDFDYIKTVIAKGKSDLNELTTEEEKMQRLEKLVESLISRFAHFLRDNDNNLFVIEKEIKEHVLKISKFNFF